MDLIFWVIVSVLSFLLVFPWLAFALKRVFVRRKMRNLTADKKIELLNTLCEPFGYRYHEDQDFFSTRLDAPQKLFGYTTLYDRGAVYFNMVFDFECFYFNYASKTWLVEIWKGQYGINIGCELGVYHADRILSSAEYDSALFFAVGENELPELSLTLTAPNPSLRSIADLPSLSSFFEYYTSPQSATSQIGWRGRHWWLTIFKPGKFSRPEHLSANASIRFPNYLMLRSFLNSLKMTLPNADYRVDGLIVNFVFQNSARKYSWFQKAARTIALLSCRTYCYLFNRVTKRYDSAGDKVLYLSFYLPHSFRRLLKLRPFQTLRRGGGFL